MSRARANLIHLLAFFLLLFHRIEWVFEKFFSKRVFSFFFKLKCNRFNTVRMTHSSFSDLKRVFCTRLFRVKCFQEIHRCSFKY